MVCQKANNYYISANTDVDMQSTPLTREQIVSFYEEMVARTPGATLKGATIPNTTHNGHMYSYVAKDNTVALKLPSPEKEQFLSRYNTRLMEQYGIVQKEYVVVPEQVLQNTSELQPWFDLSFRHISGLKPKPNVKTKKK